MLRLVSGASGLITYCSSVKSHFNAPAGYGGAVASIGDVNPASNRFSQNRMMMQWARSAVGSPPFSSTSASRRRQWMHS